MKQVISLDSREWKEFFIEDVAEIISGRDIYEKERIEGNIPYITATANNNGIGYFVDNNNETLESDCLSVNRNGSVGYCFYHPYYALYGNDTRKLRPKVQNKYTSLFLAMAISKQRFKYGYGYKMGTGRLKRQKILLPTNDLKLPDWAFMEAYMRQKEQEILKPTIERLCKHLIINELMGGGVIRSVQIGKRFTSPKYSQKFNEANALKKQTTYRGIVPMYQQPHLTMELMVLSGMRAA